ncbi:hypothetical protein [Saccharopolyspora elongata]|uniref:Uncharacterized protein n=1 Tax=Saccharopolyspora elongata TaxID=2530387 RepID=A0A4R4YI18_9PSEU|nr:hypothetical protein [Saccharopolyspora elongata]TDD43609.1 hypothetical protein E1288_26115 [Saccharopolyspora elongata]
MRSRVRAGDPAAFARLFDGGGTRDRSRTGRGWTPDGVPFAFVETKAVLERGVVDGIGQVPGGR